MTTRKVTFEAIKRRAPVVAKNMALPGFTEEVAIQELKAAHEKRGIEVVGCLLDFTKGKSSPGKK